MLTDTYVNVTVQGAQKNKVLKLMHQYFQKDTITAGSFNRKVIYFLMDLCNTTELSWVYICERIDDTSFMDYVLTLGGGLSSTVQIHHKTNSKEESEKIINTNKSNLFDGDKWIPEPVEMSEIMFTKVNGKCIVKKSRSNSKRIQFAVSVRPASLTWRERIGLSMKKLNILSDASINQEIIAFDVLRFEQLKVNSNESTTTKRT